MENAEATMEGRGAVNALSYAEQSYPFRGPAAKHFCRFICRKTFSSHYFCSRCQILHIFSGIANRASAGCSKRNHRLSAEIIGFHKGVDNRRLSVPPYRKFFCQVWTKKNYFLLLIFYSLQIVISNTYFVPFDII